MDLREITATYAVAPQIEPEDMAELAAAGYKYVICNRPDAEIGPELQANTLRAAAEAAGMEFIENPVINGAMTMEMVQNQGEAIEAAEGEKVFAYCRSGTRSTIVWGLSQAGKLPTDEILAAAARAGYDLAPFRAQIDALA